MIKDLLVNLCQIVAALFVSGGVFFFITTTIGILRMPDPYNRGHAAGKGDSPALILCLVGCWLYWLTVNWIESIKIILIVIFMLFANPIAIHSILRVCYKTKRKPVNGTTFDLLDSDINTHQDQSRQ
ncbi:MAG: monovalent cation/H(+) antiporter subunit G [bacterium]